MKKLQYTPIVNGIMITPEYLKQIELADRDARAMEYIAKTARRRKMYRWQISEAVCHGLTIVIMITLVGLMFWR